MPNRANGWPSYGEVVLSMSRFSGSPCCVKSVLSVLSPRLGLVAYPYYALYAYYACWNANHEATR